MIPMVFEQTRLRVDDAPAEMARMLTFVADRRKESRRIYGLLLAIIVVFTLAVTPFAPPMLVFGIIGAVFVISLLIKRSKALARKEAKVHFLRGLLEMFHDELHPRAPIRYRFDLRAYDAHGKRERTGRTMTGRLKEYFSDKWLHLRLVLADRTVVGIVRQQGVKVKKGHVAAEKRRLFITVTPNPRRYFPMQGQPMAERLRWQLRHAATTMFHNRPEQFHAHVAHHEHDLAIRVTQEDADILPGEVYALVGCITQHLAERCAVQQQQPQARW